MICPLCNTPMVISEWDGWIWMCFNCDHQDRAATGSEIRAQEKELETHEIKNMSDNAGCGAQDNGKEG